MRQMGYGLRGVACGAERFLFAPARYLLADWLNVAIAEPAHQQCQQDVAYEERHTLIREGF